MVSHSLRRVRVNPADGTLHCVTHGPLSNDEADDVIRRAGITVKAAIALESRGIGFVARLFDWFAARLPARCVEARP